MLRWNNCQGEVRALIQHQKLIYRWLYVDTMDEMKYIELNAIAQQIMEIIRKKEGS